MEAYVHGTSNRKVDDLVKALGEQAASRPGGGRAGQTLIG
jgi:hypothetical protein